MPVLAALLLVWVGGQAAVASDPRIDLAERGLVGKFYLAGTAHPTYSLAERMRFYHVPAVSIAVVDDYCVAWAHAYGVREGGLDEQAGGRGGDLTIVRGVRPHFERKLRRKPAPEDANGHSICSVT